MLADDAARLDGEARTGDRSRLDGQSDEPLDDVVRRFESRVALLQLLRMRRISAH